MCAPSELKPRRLAILGSANGGGAAQIIDAVADSEQLKAVAVFDSDITSVGKIILGVPVVDVSAKLFEHFKNGFFDCAVIAIGGDLDERARLYAKLKLEGVPLANVIDLSAKIRSGTTIGEGNVILGNVYIGPEVTIGNNCYLVTNATINHHSALGDHCYLSSGVNLAGRVRVGDLVRFEIGSCAKANIQIGSRSLVPAGCIITQDLPSNSTLHSPIQTIIPLE
jgi:sugar O-acyltransferase (sialic acid O-acetyltransferase NeuD family)